MHTAVLHPPNPDESAAACARPARRHRGHASQPPWGTREHPPPAPCRLHTARRNPYRYLIAEVQAADDHTAHTTHYSPHSAHYTLHCTALHTTLQVPHRRGPGRQRGPSPPLRLAEPRPRPRRSLSRHPSRRGGSPAPKVRTTAHCTLQAARCTLQPACCMLHAAHCTLHTA